MRYVVRLFCLALVFVVIVAAVPLAANSPTASDLLLAKAKTLESRGRFDLAAQVWQQVLMVDPRQPRALAELARWTRQSGRIEESNRYLERLRQVAPHDPEIDAIEQMKVVGPAQRARLEEAGRLAQNHEYSQAMKIYQEVLGPTPPPGEWAIAFYETEAAIPESYSDAVAGLRRLVQQYPSDSDYRLSLGRLLTYQPETRVEGCRLLAAIPPGSKQAAARVAWRQALIWDGSERSALPLIREYLQRYPDPELQATLDQAKQDKPQAAVATTREQQLGFQNLKAGNLADADAQFEAALQRNPRDAAALAGLGFVRMKQEDFASAITYLEKAKALAPDEARKLDTSIQAAKFWNYLQQGSKALADNQINEAEHNFREALNLRPKSLDALRGLAGTRMKAGDAAAAVSLYMQMTTQAPNDADAWRGLLESQVKAGDLQGAASTLSQLPAAVKKSSFKDLKFLTVLVSFYGATGQDAQLKQTLQLAIALANAQASGPSSTEVQLQLAGLLLQSGQTQRAAGIYQHVCDLTPGNMDAWQGLLSAFLQAHDYPRAIFAIQQMPKSAYNAAIRNPSFLLSMASIYEQQEQYDMAEGFIQQAIQIESQTAGHPTVGSQMALANLWLKRGHKDEANDMFRRIVEKNPENPDVWMAVLTALHSEGNDESAIEKSEEMPEPAVLALKNTTPYLTLMSSIYAGAGKYGEALRLLRQATFHYEILRQPVPTDLNLQMAWLLLNSGKHDRDLYSILVETASRRNLSSAQRDQLQNIWATWSLRQAETARLAGDSIRQIEILEAAAHALPNSIQVRSALAGAFLQKGDARQSYAIYRAWGLKGAAASDYCGAIGAALAVQESSQAEAWLREGLHRWPDDPQMLMLAARSAQSEGNFDKAKQYWSAALRAVPASAGSPIGATTPQAPVGSMGDLAKLLVPTSATDLGGIPSPSEGAGSLEMRDENSPLTHYTPDPPLPEPKFQSKAKSGHATAGSVPAASVEPISASGLGPAGQNDYNNPAVDMSGTNYPGTDTLTPGSQSGSATAASPLGQAQDGEELAFLPGPTTSSVQNSQSQDQTMREEIENQLAALQSRNGPFADVGAYVSSRSGQSGFDRLAEQDIPIEGSFVIDDKVRITTMALPVFLTSGTPDGSSTYRFGTSPVGTMFGSQSAAGLAGEVQVSTQDFGLRLGETPSGFLLHNYVGGIRWTILGGPITVSATRDPVKDSMLSYAGSRDPGTGQTWGGVMANTAALRANFGGAAKGFYGSIDYGQLNGKQVETNTRVSGNVGAYWRALSNQYGALTVGANFSAMHYDENLRFFTLGQGGYFSPQQYVLFNVPVRWGGHYGNNFSYSISGSLGSQQFREDASPFFPNNTLSQRLTEPYYPGQSVNGVNYSLKLRGEYRLQGNWYVDGFVDVNNANDYKQAMMGLTIRYLFDTPAWNPENALPSIPDWKGSQPLGLRD